MKNYSRYLQPRRHRPWWRFPSAVLLAASATYCGYYAHATSFLTSEHLASIATERVRRIAAAPQKPSRAQLEQQKIWEQLALERDFQWDNVFQALQNSNNPEIELLEFRPEKPQAVMILRGEAKTVAALSEYVQKLGEQPVFALVYLTKQDLTASGPQATVGFEIRARLVKQ